MATRIGFVGAGRVGKGLALALGRAGYEICGISSRSGVAPQAIVDRSEVVFLTVPDDAIAAVAHAIRWRKGIAAVHCSGAAELEVLASAKAAGAAVGGFHPLQMFADPEVAAGGLARCAIAVEAEGGLEQALLDMVRALGARSLRIPRGGRSAYHAAAHYAGPFLCASLEEAALIWQRIGIAREDALAALVPLARGALDAVERSGPARAMAGAIARGDADTVSRHLRALEALGGDFAPLYRDMALRTVALALEAGSIDAGRADMLRKLLAA